MAKETVTVADNEEAQRYEAWVEGQLSLLQYERSADRIAFNHTEVPQALEGRGIASSLARAALEDAHAQNLTVVPLCPFVRSYIERHPEYMQLVDPPYRARMD